MTKTEIRTTVKNAIIAKLAETFETAVLIDDYTYAIPMGIAADNGAPLYAKIDVSCPNWYVTKANGAFDLQAKIDAYHAELNERAAKAEAKAKAAAEKEAKRQAKEAE